MNITLQPELARFLSEQVEQGMFSSVEAAINESVQLLVRQKLLYKDRFEELQQEILRGVEDSERGDVIEGKVLFAQWQERLNQRRQRERG
ncbi:MAG: type II toxin-antitoxin system ParD family antitoxin [Spirulina sp. SIO3F2]|nr:type II toxin-antitoxin system ParD family antitoxin [Spirulina sp. SIO3F2]